MSEDRWIVAAGIALKSVMLSLFETTHAKGKTMRRTGIGVAVLLSVVLIISCGDSDDEPFGSLPTISASEQPNRDEFIDNAETRIDDLEARISEARAEAENLSEEARGDAGQEIEALENRLDEIRSKLEELSGSSDEDLDSLKTDIEEALNSTETELEDLADGLGI